MNNPISIHSNFELINELFVLNIKNIESVSSFLARNTSLEWDKYNAEENPNKKNKFIKNIRESLDKLKVIESKKRLDYDKVKLENLEYLNKHIVDYDQRYVKSTIKTINNITNLFSLYQYLLSEIPSYTKIKTTMKKKVNKTIKYVKDKEGFIYANMKLENGLLVFDRTSFNNEVYLFNEALKNNTDLILEVPEEYGKKLALLERKRRIYVMTMFNLNREMNNIYSKNIDILFPIDKYFGFANEIVANLYKELFDYNKDNLSFNKLWRETINKYGSSRCLNLYENIYWNLVNKFQDLDDSILNEYIDLTSMEKIRKENVSFRDIENIIPSPEDIFYVVSNLIIKKAVYNFEYYMSSDDAIRDSIHYMNIKQIVDFYKILKDLMIERKYTNKYFIKLQKLFAMEIGKRTNSNYYRSIVMKYFHEEVIF